MFMATIHYMLAILLLAGVMTLTVIFFRSEGYTKRTWSWIGFAIGAMVRFIQAIVLAMLILNNNTIMVFMIRNHDTWWCSLLLGNEFQFLELSVRNQYEKVNTGDQLTYFDPFQTDQHDNNFLTINGMYYSIGPDLTDDKILIIYDPTNGIIGSRGDIVWKKK